MVMLRRRPTRSSRRLEPGAATFAVLEANTRANPAFAWRAHRLAVWRAAGPVAFGAMDASTSSRIDELAPGGRVEMVEAVTLGGFAAQHAPGPIFLVKLDVEGAEEAVLASSEAVLDRGRTAARDPPSAATARVMRSCPPLPHVPPPGRRLRASVRATRAGRDLASSAGRLPRAFRRVGDSGLAGTVRIWKRRRIRPRPRTTRPHRYRGSRGGTLPRRTTRPGTPPTCCSPRRHAVAGFWTRRADLLHAAWLSGTALVLAFMV